MHARPYSFVTPDNRFSVYSFVWFLLNIIAFTHEQRRHSIHIWFYADLDELFSIEISLFIRCSEHVFPYALLSPLLLPSMFNVWSCRRITYFRSVKTGFTVGFAVENFTAIGRFPTGSRVPVARF